MKPELEEKLFTKHADLLEQVPYLEVDDGWYTLLDNMLTELAGAKIKFVQIKSKFASGRFYFDFTEDRSPAVDDIISKYEKISGKTCEVCGAPGELRSGGWLYTLCDTHAAEKLSKHGG